MGRRITIDSATMLNKGLEIIEACRLFDVTPAQVAFTVHPQSTFIRWWSTWTGRFLAQISVTDMRLPILYALAYPERPASTLTFDMAALSHLDFEQPDFERFLACAWPSRPPKKAEHTASLSTQPTRWPSRPSWSGKSPSQASRVQLKKCSIHDEAHPATIAGRVSRGSGRRARLLARCWHKHGTALAG